MPRTSFRPEVNGFAFANSWQFDEVEVDRIRGLLREPMSTLNSMSIVLSLRPLALPFIGKVRNELKTRVDHALVNPYGLCGGMAFAALDYYDRPDRHFPRGTIPNKQPLRDTPEGERLRSYLWGRLIDSLAANISTFLVWMAFLHSIPDQPLIGGGPRWLSKQTAKQWTKLKAILDSGRPWPIGLIGTTADPTLNHQIVATGYEDHPDGTGILYVYDMNCPGVEQMIRIMPRDGLLRLDESCKIAERGPLQGFFCERYTVNREPPEIAWP